MKHKLKRKANRGVRLNRLVGLLAKKLGSEVTEVTVRMRECEDVQTFLKKLDAVQKRTAKSKLHFGAVTAL